MEMMRGLPLLLLPACALFGAGVDGRVTNSITGKPLNRAYVVLRGIAGGSNTSPAETYICQTGADGRFAVADMAPGRYEAEASHDGFQAKPPDRAPSPLYFPQFTVEAGQGASGISIRLTPLVILAGMVASESGVPVPNSTVEALQNRYTQGRKVLRTVQRTETDDHGEYRFSNLPPGHYFLRATNGNQEPALVGGIDARGPARTRIYMPVYYPTAPDADRAAALDVTPGDELEHVDIRIRRVFTYSIRGTAPPDAQPAIVRNAATSGFAYLTKPRSGPDHDGFEITGLPPARYPVRATKGPTLFAFRRVEITDQDVDGVDLAHPTGVDIPGTVEFTGPKDSLRVLLGAAEAGSGTDTDAAVNADGSFTLNGQPDAYIVRVQAPAGTYLKSVKVGDRERPDHRLNPGSDSGKLSLVVASDTGKVEGTVTGADGKPAVRATVSLIPDQTLPYWNDLSKTVATGATGNFELSGVVPGNYRLFAWTDVEVGAPEDPDFRKPFEGQGVAVQVGPSGSVSVKLTAIDPGVR